MDWINGMKFDLQSLKSELECCAEEADVLRLFQRSGDGLLKMINLLDKLKHCPVQDCMYEHFSLLENISELLGSTSEKAKEVYTLSVSEKYLDVVINPVPLCQTKMEVIRLLNLLLEDSPQFNQEILKNETVVIKLESLFLDVPKAGDIELQSMMMECLFRFYPTKTAKTKALKNVIEDPDIFSALLAIRGHKFESDCRKFLNSLNKKYDSGHKRVISFPAEYVKLDGEKLLKPPDDGYDDFWVDFNTGSKRVSVFCQPFALSSQLTQEEARWETLSLRAQDVQKFDCKDSGKAWKITMEMKTGAQILAHPLCEDQSHLFVCGIKAIYNAKDALVATFGSKTSTVHSPVKVWKKKGESPESSCLSFPIDKDKAKPVGRTLSQVSQGSNDAVNGVRREKVSVPCQQMCYPANSVISQDSSSSVYSSNASIIKKNDVENKAKKTNECLIRNTRMVIDDNQKFSVVKNNTATVSASKKGHTNGQDSDDEKGSPHHEDSTSLAAENVEEQSQVKHPPEKDKDDVQSSSKGGRQRIDGRDVNNKCGATRVGCGDVAQSPIHHHLSPMTPGGDGFSFAMAANKCKPPYHSLAQAKVANASAKQAKNKAAIYDFDDMEGNQIESHKKPKNHKGNKREKRNLRPSQKAEEEAVNNSADIIPDSLPFQAPQVKACKRKTNASIKEKAEKDKKASRSQESSKVDGKPSQENFITQNETSKCTKNKRSRRSRSDEKMSGELNDEKEIQEKEERGKKLSSQKFITQLNDEKEIQEKEERGKKLSSQKFITQLNDEKEIQEKEERGRKLSSQKFITQKDTPDKTTHRFAWSPEKPTKSRKGLRAHKNKTLNIESKACGEERNQDQEEHEIPSQDQHDLKATTKKSNQDKLKSEISSLNQTNEDVIKTVTAKANTSPSLSSKPASSFSGQLYIEVDKNATVAPWNEDNDEVIAETQREISPLLATDGEDLKSIRHKSTLKWLHKECGEPKAIQNRSLSKFDDLEMNDRNKPALEFKTYQNKSKLKGKDVTSSSKHTAKSKLPPSRNDNDKEKVEVGHDRSLLLQSSVNKSESPRAEFESEVCQSKTEKSKRKSLTFACGRNKSEASPAKVGPAHKDADKEPVKENPRRTLRARKRVNYNEYQISEQSLQDQWSHSKSTTQRKEMKNKTESGDMDSFQRLPQYSYMEKSSSVSRDVSKVARRRESWQEINASFNQNQGKRRQGVTIQHNRVETVRSSVITKEKSCSQADPYDFDFECQIQSKEIQHFVPYKSWSQYSPVGEAKEAQTVAQEDNHRKSKKLNTAKSVFRHSQISCQKKITFNEPKEGIEDLRLDDSMSDHAPEEPKYKKGKKCRDSSRMVDSKGNYPTGDRRQFKREKESSKLTRNEDSVVNYATIENGNYKKGKNRFEDAEKAHRFPTNIFESQEGKFWRRGESSKDCMSEPDTPDSAESGLRFPPLEDDSPRLSFDYDDTHAGVDSPCAISASARSEMSWVKDRKKPAEDRNKKRGRTYGKKNACALSIQPQVNKKKNAYALPIQPQISDEENDAVDEEFDFLSPCNSLKGRTPRLTVTSPPAKQTTKDKWKFKELSGNDSDHHENRLSDEVTHGFEKKCRGNAKHMTRGSVLHNSPAKKKKACTRGKEPQLNFDAREKKTTKERQSSLNFDAKKNIGGSSSERQSSFNFNSRKNIESFGGERQSPFDFDSKKIINSVSSERRSPFNFDSKKENSGIYSERSSLNFDSKKKSGRNDCDRQYALNFDSKMTKKNAVKERRPIHHSFDSTKEKSFGEERRPQVDFGSKKDERLSIFGNMGLKVHRDEKEMSESDVEDEIEEMDAQDDGMGMTSPRLSLGESSRNLSDLSTKFNFLFQEVMSKVSGGGDGMCNEEDRFNPMSGLISGPSSQPRPTKSALKRKYPNAPSVSFSDETEQSAKKNKLPSTKLVKRKLFVAETESESKRSRTDLSMSSPNISSIMSMSLSPNASPLAGFSKSLSGAKLAFDASSQSMASSREQDDEREEEEEENPMSQNEVAISSALSDMLLQTSIRSKVSASTASESDSEVRSQLKCFFKSVVPSTTKSRKSTVQDERLQAFNTFGESLHSVCSKMKEADRDLKRSEANLTLLWYQQSQTLKEFTTSEQDSLECLRKSFEDFTSQVQKSHTKETHLKTSMKSSLSKGYEDVKKNLRTKYNANSLGAIRRCLQASMMFS